MNHHSISGSGPEETKQEGKKMEKKGVKREIGEKKALNKKGVSLPITGNPSTNIAVNVCYRSRQASRPEDANLSSNKYLVIIAY